MTTYTKFKEYIWLVNTIYHAKAITFAEINERWIKTDMSGGVDFVLAPFCVKLFQRRWCYWQMKS